MLLCPTRGPSGFRVVSGASTNRGGMRTIGRVPVDSVSTAQLQGAPSHCGTSRVVQCSGSEVAASCPSAKAANGSPEPDPPAQPSLASSLPDPVFLQPKLP